MGATNQIQDLNILSHLRGLKCRICKQLFTEEELRNGNFELWFSTHSHIEWKEISHSGTYWVGIFVNYISHKQRIFKRLINDNPRTEQEDKYFNCPDTELCNNCDERFLSEKMKEFKGDYYCSPCYQNIKDHE